MCQAQRAGHWSPSHGREVALFVARVLSRVAVAPGDLLLRILMTDCRSTTRVLTLIKVEPDVLSSGHVSALSDATPVADA